jgi:hypothetical protein
MRVNPVKSQDDLPEHPEIDVSRTLKAGPGAVKFQDELQKVAAHLMGTTVADLIGISPQEDGSLRVAAYPAGKRHFTAEEVQRARLALAAASVPSLSEGAKEAAHVADPIWTEPRRQVPRLNAGPRAEGGSPGAQSAGATEGASTRAVGECRPESSEHSADQPRNPLPESRARKRGGSPPAPAGGRARRRCP